MTPSTLALRLPSAASLDGTLATIDEMIERLETVTDAGRQHLMSKIVSGLVSHPAAATAPVVAARVEVLRREAERAAPDGNAFTRIARPLVALLAAAAQQRARNAA